MTDERELEEEFPFTAEGVAALCEASDDMFDASSAEEGHETGRAKWKRRALVAEALASARQVALEAAQAQAAEVRRETVEECAQHLTTLADAMHEKAEAIADRSSRHGPFVRPLTSERDAAVTAYDFEQAATAIRALTDAAKEPDHVPDAGNMIAKVAGDHIPDAGEMVGKDNANG